MIVFRELRFGYKDYNVVIMKNVEGQFLWCEQSYIGVVVLFEGDYNFDCDVDDYNGVEFMYSLKKFDFF